MAEALYDRLNLLKGRKLEFVVEDQVSDFKGRPDLKFYTPTVDYAGLSNAYGIEPSKTFEERIVNLENPSDLYNPSDITLRLRWVTSADVIAHRKEKIEREAINSLAACGILITKDNQIPIGIRGGAITPERIKIYGSGLFGMPPGGSATFKTKYDIDPITDSLIAEFKEEVGEFEVRPYGNIGTLEANTPGPIGLKFVGVLRTDATLEQIQRTNIESNRMYDDLMAKGINKKDVKKEIEKIGLPPDAWEHSMLIGIPNDSVQIKKLLGAQSQAFCGVVAGMLALYAQGLEEDDIPK